MADVVARLPGVLTRLLGPEASWPRVIFSDRGPGFFVSSTGHIVKAYRKALKKYGFRTYQGEDASGQPADLADVFPHETAARRSGAASHSSSRRLREESQRGVRRRRIVLPLP